MSRPIHIALLPGDGIGPEVTLAAVAVLRAVAGNQGFEVRFSEHLVGGAAIDGAGAPLPPETLRACKEADAVFLGAVGGPQWDAGTGAMRPEAGLLALRKELGTFANLRPVAVPPALAARSPLRPEQVSGADLLIVRELTGGIYFGQPREESETNALDTMRYTRPEVVRIAHVAAEWARRRGSYVTSVDKANVLASSRLWRSAVVEVMAGYPDIQLDHLYVDNAAMQIVRDPRRFDVILTGNLFGDILSDLAATLPGSLGVLPSASVGTGVGIFEPVHGSAPDIAGKDIANPTGAVLSMAMMMDHLARPAAAWALRQGVQGAMDEGLFTADLAGLGRPVGTAQMTEAIVRHALTTETVA